MTDNIYDAPEADLEAEQGSGPEFFRVGHRKLIIMAIFTFGFYTLYWYYRHWDSWRKYHQADIWPIPRAIFSIFFVLPLFRRFKEAEIRQAIASGWSYRSTGWSIIAINLILSFGIPFLFGVSSAISGAMGSDTSFVANLGLMVLFSSVLGYILPPIFMAKAQDAANRVLSLDTEADPNEKITLANVGWIILGVLLTGIGIINDLVQIMLLYDQ